MTFPAPKPSLRIRDDDARSYVRGLACLLASETPCECGPFISVTSRRIAVEAAHVRSWGAGSDDVKNLIPLCAGHHRLLRACLHQAGRRTFEREHREALGYRTLRQIARVVWANYREDRAVRDFQ